VWTFDIVSLLLDTIPPINRGIKWVVIVMKYNNIILNKNRRCYLPFLQTQCEDAVAAALHFN
jgi:hypothetical protein